jgi:hypothetical protein
MEQEAAPPKPIVFAAIWTQLAGNWWCLETFNFEQIMMSQHIEEILNGTANFCVCRHIDRAAYDRALVEKRLAEWRAKSADAGQTMQFHAVWSTEHPPPHTNGPPPEFLPE